MRKLTIGILAILLCHCGEDDENNRQTLTLGFQGLEPLGQDYVYEGWLIVGGAPVSTGRFSINASGDPEPGSFEIDANTAQNGSPFVLTIEPVDNDPPEPAKTHVLAGNVANGEAQLSVSHTMALGTDFASASGAFILATPSSADPNDGTQGIWWLDPTQGPGPSLVLPALPEGWAYEGWVVGANGPTSTGRFRTAAGADSDGVGPDGGTDMCTTDDSCPPFPGQDFITPPLDLVGLTAVISVEPDPDDSDAPFALKPLVDASIENVAPPMTQSMANQSATNNPSGTVKIE